MGERLAKLILVVGSVFAFLMSSNPAKAQSWSNGYAFRRTITIDHTKVPNTDQTNFPVLISGTYSFLATTSNGGGVTSSKGYDINFTSDAAGTNFLPFERESYSSSTGAASFWIQIPTLSHTSDTVIYMFYGNGSVTTDPSNKTAVWDSNFVGVWHLPNGTTLSSNDSTHYGNNGDAIGATAASGKIGGAASFNGSNQYIDAGDNSSLQITGNTISVETWVYTTVSNPSAWQRMIVKETTGNADPYTTFGLTRYAGTNKLSWGIATGGSGSGKGVESASSLAMSGWTHVVCTYDGSNLKIYVNGALDAQAAASGNIVATTQDVVIGADTAANQEYFSGTLDEVRISNSARSADWISAEYQNQNNPGTFYSVGSAVVNGLNGSSSPYIAELAPVAAPVAASVSILGANFGATQGSSTVTFNGTAATPTTWTASSIVVPVPASATSGSVVVTVSGTSSNGVTFTVTPPPGSGYAFQRTITIDHTKVPNTDQPNFPLLISGTYSFLANAANGGNVTSPYGYDIIFTSDAAGMNLLPFEQDSYSATTGAINYWVQVPNVSHTTDTVIYMFYGNGAATADQSNRAGVWDSNYQGVWHLGNGLTLSASDSTGNANSGTVNGNIAAAAGKINGAASAIGGTNNGITTPSSITADNSPFTYFFWVNSSGGGTTVQRGQDGFGNGWSANVWFNSNAHFSIVNSSPSQITLNGNATISNGTWYNVAAVWAPGSGMKLYVNGALDNSNTNSSTILRSSTKPLQLLSDNGNNSFNGLLDEVQISSVARSGDWIAAEYNNQSSPSTFYSIGTQGVIGSGGGTSPYIAGSWPASGPVTSPMTIFGVNFGSTQGSSTVTFNGTAGSPNFWSDSTILVSVPSTATSGNVVVTVSGTSSNPSNFTVTTAPGAWSTSPTSGLVGLQVAIGGINFGSTQGSSAVTLNGLNCSVVSWSNTSITVVVPSGATSGPFTVSVGTQTAKSPVFTVTQIPTGWLDQDIGSVGVAGSASYANSTFTVNGAGGGTIATAADGINFMYQPLSGDGTIVARVVSTQGGGSQEAGVMIRETLSAGATNAETFYFAGNSQDFNITERTTTGAATSSYLNSQAIAASLPYWVKLTRSGTSFTGYVSADGVYWTQIASSQTISMAQNVYIGLFVTNRSTSAAATATFDNVSVTSAASPAPSVTSVSATTGAIGNQVVISGQNFGSSQGSSVVLVNGTAATINSWSSTSVTMTVPTGASTGYLAVAVAPTMNSSNPIWFQVTSQPLPSGWLDRDIGYGSMFKQRGAATYASGSFSVQASGTFISGTADAFHFVYQPLSGDGTILARVTGVNNGEAGVMIRETLDPASTMAYVRFTPSNAYFVTRTSSGASASQQSSGFGASGTPYWLKVTRSGNTFSAYISLDGVYWTQVSTSQTITMASNVFVGLAYSDDNTGSVGSATFDSAGFTAGSPAGTPTVTSATPTVAGPGYSVTINGSGFGAAQGSSQAYFNGAAASAITSWSDTQIVATVPTAASTGPVSVVVNGVGSNETVSITVYKPNISSLTPPAAQTGGTVTLAGSGFGSQSGNSVSFNGVTAGVSSWTSTSITVTVPSSATTGPVTVTEGGIVSNGVQFTVLEPLAVTGFSPSTGPVGTAVIISGAGFGSSQSNSFVDFNGTIATISSWSDTQITAVVPSGTASGSVNVNVAAQEVFGPQFTVTWTASLTDSLGNSTSYTSSMIGGTWLPTNSQGSGCSTCSLRGTIQSTYDGNGNVLTRTDELGRTTTYTYDANNNVTSVSVPIGNGTNAVTSYTYNSFGEVLITTDPLGNVTTNTYDSNGNLTKVTTPVPGTGASASVTQFAYDSKGELTTITDPLNNATAITYTAAGLIQTITDAQSNVTTYGYDAHGNRTSVTDALNHTTSFTYDSGDRLTKITYPDTTTTQFGYDNRGRRTSVTDQNGKVTTYAYDDADRLLTVTDAANNVTTYGYDTENNLTSITDANSHTTNFAYDAFGRVTQTTFPSSAVETYSYDAVGNLTGKTDRKNQSITYTYDQLNRLTQKTYPDNSTVNYTYDNDSRLTQVTDPTGTYSFTFDNMGRLTGTTTGYSFLTSRTFTTAYSYDVASNRVGFADPEGGSTSYAYDTLNRLQTLTPPAAISGGSFGFNYDVLSRRTSLTRPNAVNTTYSYDNLSRLLSVTHAKSGTTLDGATYTVDSAGNRTSKTDLQAGLTTNYGYDAIYQLLNAAQGGTTTESYTYDPVGNRLTSFAIPSYSYNPSNELISTSSATYGYDNNGNTTSKTDSTGTTSYAWDFENRLTSVTLPGSNGTVSFRYDPFGRRIYKSSTTATSVFTYDGDDLIEETNATGTVVSRYQQGESVDEPLATLRSATTSFYEADGLGSVTSISSSAGSLAQTYSYDSFGKQTSSSGSLTNPFQYTGRESDSETTLYFLRARYFDPTAGRFISEDPTTFFGGHNFYTYVGNWPTIYTDPSGLSKVCNIPPVGPHTKLPPPITTCASNALLDCIIQTESQGNPKAKSKKGAAGAMQVTPSAIAELKHQGLFTKGMTNSQIGTTYINLLLTYCSEVATALAAYNAGPGAVNKAGAIPNFPETQSYVHKINNCLEANGLKQGVNDPGAAGGCTCR